MIDVSHKKCTFGGCNLRPNFGKVGSSSERCSKHKEKDMIELGHKKCEAENCDAINLLYDINGGKGSFCIKHKTDEMIDVKSKRCEAEGCEIKSPSFNIKGEKGKYCYKHKTNEMINVSSNSCMQDGCESRVYYGKPGHPRSHCALHRLKGMIIKPNSKCLDCKEPAFWGSNRMAIHCEMHKTENEQNLTERDCTSCGLTYILDKNDKCENCNPESWLIVRLAKQNALMSYLDGRGLTGISTDKIIDGGACGKERPDRVYDFGDKIVIVECDEMQHKNNKCEESRMFNLGQAFGGIPVYFIRWNPDDYCDENNRKKSELLSKRYKLLGNLITDIKENKHTKIPKALVSVIYMYYDGWSSLDDEEWILLVPFISNGII
jgi:hypothetical protein